MTQPALQRVLLVDDDKVTNLMHGRLIRRSGLIGQIDVATDGVAALEYLQARTDAGDGWPELILLDINMPRMDGFEFLESYAALPAECGRAETLIIMLSTSVLRADHARAEADPHVHAFVSKPLASDDIVRFVHAAQSRRVH
ncbi:response regulator [Roseobacter sinensis]|uniref:Response regulator n=1 Tax=Roseobacter sinensis TaxID=2931391 RepID=A0ABT3BGI3_9RHOB|nr:response regulator [Roseobacter sp. WL0113]MCV3272695.1 response regulator [Roseobacter sp. WL0113]